MADSLTQPGTPAAEVRRIAAGSHARPGVRSNDAVGSPVAGRNVIECPPCDGKGLCYMCDGTGEPALGLRPLDKLRGRCRWCRGTGICYACGGSKTQPFAPARYEPKQLKPKRGFVIKEVTTDCPWCASEYRTPPNCGTCVGKGVYLAGKGSHWCRSCDRTGICHECGGTGTITALRYEAVLPP